MKVLLVQWILIGPDIVDRVFSDEGLNHCQGRGSTFWNRYHCDCCLANHHGHDINKTFFVLQHLIAQGAWQIEKTSEHPLGRFTSPTYVCALVLYLGNAQTTQKQHCPIAQKAWRTKKKSAQRGFSPATHWVVTQVLGTFVHLYCTLAMRKQHKNNMAPLPRELGKRKK